VATEVVGLHRGERLQRRLHARAAQVLVLARLGQHGLPDQPLDVPDVDAAVDRRVGYFVLYAAAISAAFGVSEENGALDAAT
jgi:hypothetical protein